MLNTGPKPLGRITLAKKPSPNAARKALEAARDELIKQYKISGNGIIRDPGPFESLPIFVAHYYEEEIADEEFVDEYERDVVMITPDELDRQIFPELGNVPGQGIIYHCLWIWEDESGRVHWRGFTTPAEEKSARDEIAQAEDDEEGLEGEDEGDEDEPPEVDPEEPPGSIEE